MEHIVIIGNGISGITAARHIRKRSDKKITVISAESDYFFSRTALMYVYMGHMKWEHLKPYEDWFWDKNDINLLNKWVENIDFPNKILKFSDGGKLSYDKLVLATGSVYNKFGWEGEDLDGVQGLVSKQDLEELEENTKFTKHAVIVGGGLIGVELAEMLSTRNIKVSFLIREKAFWHSVLPLQDAQLISRHIQSHNIDLRHNTGLDRILSGPDGRVRAVKTTEGEEIECQLVGLCAGVRPNIEFLRNTELETDRGILVNPYLETNISDVYAIGDCAQHRKAIGQRKPVEAVWYTGRIMGETLAKSLTGDKTPYEPGIWFNSAKFFDIEYQTYGWVWPKPKENERHLHWEHQSGLKAVTVSFDTNTNEFLGINTFGIRMRHNIIESWLKENRSITYVLSNLKAANFDPEFYEHHEKEIFNSFKNNLQEA
ncbi:NAD(P)/FAD-dependent oxidoreductase [Christiangramia salexigens]|uniref:FAD-dependent oxidoreductase n=1 Tax=Christiangramia salexigens TaxID=1913577 RepID=A0A1L3J616_9FLAO|nr:FAD/NAD(P)-binding oxidoreductase [Christiangramia salexigens]APG60544.1 FAD-dependent oxidoreductase [Christiangramia salexigens]